MQEKNFILQSRRLSFRRMEKSHLQNLTALDTNPEVRAYFPNGISSQPETQKRIKRSRKSFEGKGYCDFAIIHKQSEKFVGRAGFGDIEGGEIEVGYVLLKEFWGRGLAQEALKALLAWAQESIQAKRILAYAPVSHFASINVMKKGDMQYLKTEKIRNIDYVFYEYRL
jgi:ribosomal-protein-alanine N-acetyltransferase